MKWINLGLQLAPLFCRGTIESVARFKSEKLRYLHFKASSVTSLTPRPPRQLLSHGPSKTRREQYLPLSPPDLNRRFPSPQTRPTRQFPLKARTPNMGQSVISAIPTELLLMVGACSSRRETPTPLPRPDLPSSPRYAVQHLCPTLRRRRGRS